VPLRIEADGVGHGRLVPGSVILLAEVVWFIGILAQKDNKLPSGSYVYLIMGNSRLSICLAALLLVTLAISFAQTPGKSALQQLEGMRQSLRSSRDKKDWGTYGTYAAQLEEFLNGSPRSLLEMARADLMRGRTAEAKAEVQYILEMGQAEDALLTAPFDSLHLDVAVAANRKPVANATLAEELQDTGLLPEDIDYDASTKRFFLTSVLEKKIVTVGPDGKIRDFAPAPDGWPMLALKIDPERHRLWATEVALKGFSIVQKSDWARSAVLCYNLDNGRLLFRIEGPENSALGDMALMRDGVPVVSDGEGGGVYRVDDGKTLERIDRGDFISPQTPSVSADGRSFFVPDYLRGIGILDLTTRQVRWLAMDNKFILNGIDGLYLHGDSILAVQNGSSPERVISFRLDPSHSKVTSQNVIEAATNTIGDPTHGVIVGSDFYYIANSGWDTLDDSGERRATAKVTMARIMRAVLPE